MIFPHVRPWVEQTNELAGSRINAGNVWPLETIAMKAGKSKVPPDCCTSMLPRNDMVNLERKAVLWMGNSTILASTLRGCPHLLKELPVH
jgi:hypothetical protein